MELTQKLIEQIQKMKNGGLSGKEIQDLANLPENADILLKRYEEKMEGLLKADEVAIMLNEALAKTGEKFNYDKVLRLARNNKLKVYQQQVGESGKSYKRGGYTFHINDVQDFIKDKTITKEELKAIIDEKDAIIKELEARLASYEGTVDEPASGVTEVLPEEKKSLKIDSGEPELTKERAKELIFDILGQTDEVDAILEKMFRKKETIKWESKGKFKNPMKLRGKGFDTEREAIEAALSIEW